MQPTATPTKKSRLTLYIIICLVIGIALGFILNQTYLEPENLSLQKIDATIKGVVDQIGQATDSDKVALEAQKASLDKERNAILAARDTKVEPFSLLADIF